MHDVVSFGRWLKLRRISLELTQAKLAHQVGCAVVTIRKIEADERRPSLQIAERLAQALAIAAQERADFLHASQAVLSPLRLQPPAPVAPASTIRGSLPMPPTPFIGRGDVVTAVCDSLCRGDVRLLTLTGVGGVGKTRVAIQAATELQQQFTDGVWFVPLTSMSDPSHAIRAIAQAFGVHEFPGETLEQTMGGILRERHLLLVLDNFEQILAAAVLVADLLAAAPSITMLITSRAPLHIAAEHQFLIPPMTLPEPMASSKVEHVMRSEAAALFVARAQAVRHDFVVTEANAPVIAAICMRLEGLPLALELAASRCKLFAPAALLTRLDRRLDTLTGGSCDQPVRQHTLRATIDWSYTLLSPIDQQVFAELAVFAGGWTLAAATAICTTGSAESPALVGIEALLEHSLIQAAPAARDPQAELRFTMLETIREYARELLAASGASEMLHARHAAYYLQLAEAAAPILRGPEQHRWLAQLHQEQDNLRAALAWAIENNAVEEGLRLAWALCWFWVNGSAFSEGNAWLHTLLARSVDTMVDPVLLAHARFEAGFLTYLHDDLSTAIPLLEASLKEYRSADERCGIARTLHTLGLAVAEQGDPKRGAALLDEALAFYRELGDVHGRADALLGRSSLTALWDSDFSQATAMAEESLRWYRAVGDIRGTMNALNQVGWFIHDRGDLERGVLLVEEALAIARTLGEPRAVLHNLGDLAIIEGRRGNLAHARELLEEQLERAQLRRLHGDHMSATAYLAETAASNGEMLEPGQPRGYRAYWTFAMVYLAVTARYRGDVTEAQRLLDEVVQHERVTMTSGWAALIHRYRADVLADQGTYKHAMQVYRRSLVTFRDLRLKWDCAACLEMMAWVLGAQGHAERALRLWSASSAARDLLGTPLPPVDQPRRDAALKVLHAQLGELIYRAIWSEGQALSLEQAVAEALQ